MMIEIAASGGFAGLSLPSQTRTVEVDALDTGMRARVCEAFDPAALRRLEDAPRNDGAADRMTYDITVREEDGAADSFRLSEDRIPAEMLRLIDQM